MRWLTLPTVLVPLLVTSSLAQDAAVEAPPPPPKKMMGTLELESGATGAEVAIDGVVVGVVPLPGPWTLPPGPHRVEVRPANGERAKAKVDITAGEVSRLTLLERVEEVVVAPERPVIERPVGPGFSLSTAGYVSAGMGLAALGAGVFFGLDANARATDARDYGTGDPEHDRAGLQALIDEAEQSAFYANLSFGVGGVALLAGAAMVALASDGLFAPRRVRARPVAGGGVLRWSF